jgi:penicillin-binding protein 1C
MGAGYERNSTIFPIGNLPFIYLRIPRIFQRLTVKRNKRRTILYLVGAFVLTGVLSWFGLPFAISLPAGLREVPPASPILLDRHGTPIQHLPLPNSSRAAPLLAEEIPADIIACTLAAEDKRFYDHGGIDLLATLRASRDFFTKRRIVSGASSITQQLIKITSPPAKRSPLTKIYEALAARRLEMTWTKRQILTAYLNHLDYGNLRIGTAEATRFYFQKPVSDLSLAECALLAGLPQSPSRLNPIRHPERAIARRNTVLKRLARAGDHAPERIAAALAEPLRLRPLAESQPAPWLAELVSSHHAQIQTTLDLPLQRDLEAIVREETAKLKEANLRHAAVVILHNSTGEILALAASANWDDPRGGQLNGALTPRSPGSTLKPFTYLLAMERLRRIPSSILADIPTPFRTEQGLDLPENYDRTYRGPVTLRSALACSLNVPALRELNSLGGPRPLHEFLVSLGITTLGKDPELHGLGLTLGNAPVKLVELTNAYATIARQGRHFPPILFPSKFEVGRSTFDVQSAYFIAEILSDSIARAPSFQPGGPLDLPFRCAVKTGTSSDFHDNWCIGFTPEFTVGVWAGNFEQQPMKGLSGIAGAGPIFHRAMVRAHRDSPPTWYTRPPDLVEITIDPRNGKLIPAESSNTLRDLAPADQIPPVATASDYDATGKALLDPSFAGWFATRHNIRRADLTLGTPRVPPEPLCIISPADNTTFLLDPEIPSGSDKLRPITNLPGTAKWHSETLRIEPASPEPIIHLTIGTHILTVTDPGTGEIKRLTLRVKSL